MQKKIGFILLIISALALLPYLLPLDENPFPESPPFENSKFANINGFYIHYRVWPSGLDSVRGYMLLIHGFSSSTFSWRHTAPFLAENGYEVVAVDLPGSGYSTRDAAFNHSDSSRAALLWQLTEHVKPDENEWNVVSHSLGGRVAAAMAIMNPEAIKSVIFEDAAIYKSGISGYKSSVDVALFPVIRKWIGVLATHFVLSEWVMDYLLSSAYGSDAGKDAVEGYLKPLKLNGTMLSYGDMFVEMDEGVPEGLPSITRPSYVIWGENDSWINPVFGNVLFSVLPNAKMDIIPGAGHNPQETHPEKFNRLLLSFLNKLN